MVKREYPPSKRIAKNVCCKNCEYIVVEIKLPTLDPVEHPTAKDIANLMKATAKAMKVTTDHMFYCVFLPKWREIPQELKHRCGQFLLRENWEAGYQDIERTWRTVDLVYETRWDCRSGPEGVRPAA